MEYSHPIKFVEHPVVCKVNSIAVKTGKSNCTWSSCREGCTADMFKCFQVKRMVLGCVVRKNLINYF